MDIVGYILALKLLIPVFVFLSCMMYSIFKHENYRDKYIRIWLTTAAIYPMLWLTPNNTENMSKVDLYKSLYNQCVPGGQTLGL